MRSGTPLLTAVEDALAAIGEGHFGDDRDETMWRMELWLGHRGVQAAAAVYVMEIVDQIAELLERTGVGTRTEARFIAAATINGFIAAIQSWYRDGAVRPAEDYIREGLAALARVLQDR